MTTVRSVTAAVLALVLGFASPALAGGGAPAKDKGAASNRVAAGFSMDAGKHEPEPIAESPRGVDLPPLAVPSIVDDQLVNYLFIQSRVIVKDGVDVWKVREKGPYLLDALLRAAHRKPLNRPDDPSLLDEDAAKAAFREALGEVIDVSMIEKIEFIAIDPML